MVDSDVCQREGFESAIHHGINESQVEISDNEDWFSEGELEGQPNCSFYDFAFADRLSFDFSFSFDCWICQILAKAPGTMVEDCRRAGLR